MTKGDGLALLARARTAEAVTAALSVISAGNPRLRKAILERYQNVGADPRRLDAGGAIRAALLRGLRAWPVTERPWSDRCRIVGICLALAARRCATR